jgi:hypothetical protein
MRIRLDNPGFVSELTDFLRRCECHVVQIGPKVLNVELRAAANEHVTLRRARAGFCTSCGGTIEPVLVNLGSPKCHDCRDGLHSDREWERMEVGAFLRVWKLRHPGAQAQLLG